MKPLPSRLMVIADAGAGLDLPAQVRAAVRGGARLLEIRRVRPADGSPESGARLAEIRRCLAEAGEAVVLVNDRVDLALLSGAAGAHVGWDDLPAREARAILGDAAWLGLSTHDEEQLSAAQDLPLDYVAFGPVFPSTTKSGHAEPLGLERLAEASRACRLPIVAIGGIDAARLPAVLQAGASCAAVASAARRGGSMEEATRELVGLAEAHAPLPLPAPGAEAIALAGPPGAGKSTVGRLVAERLGRRFADLDEVVAARAGAPSAGELLAEAGEDAFREHEARALAGLLAEDASPAGGALVVALGGGTVLASWSRALLLRAGARVVGLDVDATECARRLPRPAGRPLLEAALASPQRLAEHVEARRQAGRSLPRALVVDAAAQPEAVARRVMQALGLA